MVSIRLSHRMTATLDEEAVTNDLDILTVDERERCDRFRFFRDRRDYAAAHALARRALSACCSIPPRSLLLEARAGGKPVLVPAQQGVPAVDFSISHADGLVACAIARGAHVGVDVESIGRSGIEQIAARYFSAVELKGMEDTALADRRVRFIELWTLKEAYLKTLGVGLGLPLDSVAFQFDRSGGLASAVTDGASAGWQFALFAVGSEFRMAVAARCEAERPGCHIEFGPDLECSDRPVLVRSSSGITIGHG